MSQIRVTPELLEAEAKKLRTDATNLQTQMKQITGRLNTLHSMWEGKSATSYMAQWQDQQKHFKNTAVMLEAVAKQSDGIATTMRTTDQQISNQIGY
ncbi:WXG100 family type VII secretion target [Bacillus sp. FSL W7-1360]